MWLVRFEFVDALKSHRLHVYGFRFIWMAFTCFLKLLLQNASCLHSVHLIFFPSCIEVLWIRRFNFDVVLVSHFVHWNRTPKWTFLICFFKCSDLGYTLSHWTHLCFICWCIAFLWELKPPLEPSYSHRLHLYLIFKWTIFMWSPRADFRPVW